MASTAIALRLRTPKSRSITLRFIRLLSSSSRPDPSETPSKLYSLEEETIDDTARKSSIERLDVLGQLGGTMLAPPKEELVEKYFHQNNMSCAEELKIELKKVRNEFKMSESDCGSSPGQVAQLTTKIRHLPATLHEKMSTGNIGNGDDVEVKASEVKLEKTWPENNLRLFINLMEAEVIKGNRTRTLTKEAWTFIRMQMLEKTQKSYTQVQLKSKFHNLKQAYKDLSGLINNTSGITREDLETGFVFNADKFWSRIRKVNQNAKHFKKYGYQLRTIFEDTIGTGKHAHPSTKMPPNLKESDRDDSEKIVLELDSDKAKVQEPDGKKIEICGTNHSKKDGFGSQLNSLIGSSVESTNKKNELMEKRTQSVGSSSSLNEEAGKLRKECIVALEAMGDIDGASYTKAMKMFKNDLVWCEMFMEASERRKRDLVLFL